MNKRFLSRWFGVALILGMVGCSSQVQELRLVSYNIHHCAGADGKVDLKRVADVIAKERPDYVGLNEVDVKAKRSGNIDEATELGRMLGLHATFAESIPLQGGSYGNAILSKEKPLSVLRIPLPGREPRTLLLCEFSDCWFGATHLSLQKMNRVTSAEIIRSEIAKKTAGKPVFITGDWNAKPDSKTVAAMRGFLKILSDETRDTFNGFGKRKLDPVYCIDYIAVDKASAERIKVKESRVTPDAVTSDHNLVAVVVEMTAD